MIEQAKDDALSQESGAAKDGDGLARRHRIRLFGRNDGIACGSLRRDISVCIGTKTSQALTHAMLLLPAWQRTDYHIAHATRIMAPA
jgi:hypothetical protein